jgi:brefeldin A-resistance guanine nucleotide exchange factor 1
MSCIALEYAGLDSAKIMAAGPTPSSHGGSSTSFEGPPRVGAGDENEVTKSATAQFLMKSKSYNEINEVITGAAGHRGLLSLDCGFAMIRQQPDRIREAWPTLIECLCALRDARALPERVIFLDDFADSRGNLLPLSPFAKQSQRRLDEYYKSLGSERDTKKSWITTLFSPKKEEHGLPSMFHGDLEDAPEANEKELSSFSHSLLQVTKRAKLEQVVLMRPKNLPMAKQTVRALLDAIDAYPYFDDPIFEQHAVYSLELALLALISNRDRSVDLYPAFLEKFTSVLRGVDSPEVPPAGGIPRNMPTPFLMERVVVTILRACIHLYDIPEARPLLKKSLHLLMTLPPNFTRFVSDRIACGMAIFLSCKFQLLETDEDWEFITNLLDMLAYFGPGRGFVFDGIANTVESQMMVPEHGEEKQVLTLEGAQMLTKPLLKFVFGTYQNDISLSIPGMMCLENLYRHIALLNSNDGSENAISANGEIMVHDQVLWQNVAVAFYAVCRNADPSTSMQGTDCFQRFIASTPIGSLPDEKWIVLLHLICQKQPPVTTEVARVNCTTLLCKILLMSIAHLSQNEEYWEDLTDIVNQMAVLVGENLRMGRRGNVSPLFESTLQSVTFLCNHMVSDNFTGHEEYGNWVSDTLLSELEKVGASGGSSKNLAATKSMEGFESMETKAR